MKITSPAELAAIHPIDITDQAHFNELLAAIPRPVPQEWKVQYGRMNAIARRHGYAWPYKIRIADPKTTGRPRALPVPVALRDLPPGTTIPHKGGIVGAVPRTQSANHIADRDGWEYFYDNNGYPQRAPLTSPVDQEEAHRVIGMEEACGHDDWPALHLALTGKELYS